MTRDALTAIGLIMTAIGIILGIIRPRLSASWSGGETERREWWLGLRYFASISLIIVGTLLQLAALLT